MTMRVRLVGIAGMMSLLLGCYPNGPEYVTDLDLVVTNHDKALDFNDLNTYAMPNEVVKITGSLAEGDDAQFVDPEYANLILDAVRDNLNNYGWTEVGVDQADVILLPSVMTSTTFIWYYDWWYWDWYYPYIWDGWYYPYGVGGSYSSGTLFLQMTYPEGISPIDNIPVPWSAVLNGLLEGSDSKIGSRVDKGIDQAFKQSPFLDID